MWIDVNEVSCQNGQNLLETSKTFKLKILIRLGQEYLRVVQGMIQNGIIMCSNIPDKILQIFEARFVKTIHD